MLTTPHVLLGLYFITYYPPQVALPAALISHFLFDFFFPHWNPHIYTEMKTHGHVSRRSLSIIFGDVIIAALITLYFGIQALPNLLQSITIGLAALLAILPDLMEMPYYFFQLRTPWLVKLVTFEHNNQAKADNAWGVISQILLIALCIWQLAIH